MRKTDAKHDYVQELTAEIIQVINPIINKKVCDQTFMAVHTRLESLISREYVEVEDRKLPAELKNQNKSCKKN